MATPQIIHSKKGFSRKINHPFWGVSHPYFWKQGRRRCWIFTWPIHWFKCSLYTFESILGFRVTLSHGIVRTTLLCIGLRLPTWLDYKHVGSGHIETETYRTTWLGEFPNLCLIHTCTCTATIQVGKYTIPLVPMNLLTNILTDILFNSSREWPQGRQINNLWAQLPKYSWIIPKLPATVMGPPKAVGYLDANSCLISTTTKVMKVRFPGVKL